MTKSILDQNRNTDESTMTNMDVEKQTSDLPKEEGEKEEKSAAFKALGWLDRLLALWILLAMIIGILLGNFVPETGPALQKGKFVGVSIPIGMKHSSHVFRPLTDISHSHWLAHYDVSYLVQSSVRDIASSVPFEAALDPSRLQYIAQLDRCSFLDGKLHMQRLEVLALTSFTQLGLAWAFLPDEPALREGLILVGLARCIAMVSLLSSREILNLHANVLSGVDLDGDRWR